MARNFIEGIARASKESYAHSVSSCRTCRVWNSCPGCDEQLSTITGPTPGLQPTFSSIQREIFESTDSAGRTACTFCHTSAGRIPAGGLDLTHDAAYAQLASAPARTAPNNTNQLPAVVADHNDTFLVGLGARIRVSPTVYLVGEVTPRPAGYRPGATQGSVGLEKRAGGHLFQVNFSNAFGTTFGQIARGGPEENDWLRGFNISRKFF
jgi:hypothetical protein